MRVSFCVSALVVSILSGCGHTQGAPSAPAAPPPAGSNAPPNLCETDPAFRQFDFWLGRWAVFNPDGKKQGDNRITKVEAGCLILEQWTSIKGNTGQSYNFYDPVTKKWRQVWVSRGMVIDYEGGLNAEGAMVLTGRIHYHDGRDLPFRGTWSRLADGTVRQHFEEYNPKTEEWGDWFVGIYTPTDG